MKKYRAKVFLQDECPHLGCGWRYLKAREEEKAGKVFLRDCAGRMARMKLGEWKKVCEESAAMERRAA